MKIFVSITIGILLIAVLFLWVIVGASSHKVPLSNIFVVNVVILALLTLLIVINGFWSRAKFWLGILYLETLLYYCYKIMQPQCEPCLPNEYCPPCVTQEQIIIKFVGLSVAILFLIWQMIVAFRKSTRR